MEFGTKTNIDLGISMDTGINTLKNKDVSKEQKAIASEQGRNICKKDDVDCNIAGIANFRILSF